MPIGLLYYKVGSAMARTKPHHVITLFPLMNDQRITCHLVDVARVIAVDAYPLCDLHNSGCGLKAAAAPIYCAIRPNLPLLKSVNACWISS